MCSLLFLLQGTAPARFAGLLKHSLLTCSALRANERSLSGISDLRRMSLPFVPNIWYDIFIIGFPYADKRRPLCGKASRAGSGRFFP